jgi:hypothetical protein
LHPLHLFHRKGDGSDHCARKFISALKPSRLKQTAEAISRIHTASRASTAIHRRAWAAEQ